jgi:hypothetical protein
MARMEYIVVDNVHHETKEPLWIRKLIAVNKNKPFGSKVKEIHRIKVKKYNEDRNWEKRNL